MHSIKTINCFEQSHNFWMSLYKTFSSESLHLILPKSGEGGKPTLLTSRLYRWDRKVRACASVASPNSCSAGESVRQNQTPGLLIVNPLPNLLDSSLPLPPPLYPMESPQNCPAPHTPSPLHFIPYFIVSQTTFFGLSVLPVFKGLCFLSFLEQPHQAGFQL